MDQYDLIYETADSIFSNHGPLRSQTKKDLKLEKEKTQPKRVIDSIRDQVKRKFTPSLPSKSITQLLPRDSAKSSQLTSESNSKPPIDPRSHKISRKILQAPTPDHQQRGLSQSELQGSCEQDSILNRNIHRRTSSLVLNEGSLTSSRNHVTLPESIHDHIHPITEP
jgi:hypothetical protein